MTLHDGEGRLEVEIAAIPRGHLGKLLGLGWLGECPEGPEQLFQPCRRDHLQT